MRLNCELRGQPTTHERCPGCDFLTREWHEYRPDASPEQMAAEGVLGAINLGRARSDVLAVTTNDVPGYRVAAVHGDVYGTIVRARNYFSNLGASFRTMIGGEVVGYTKLLREARSEARQRLIDEARALGANAILAVRFDCNEIGDVMSEITAYGTAVTIERLPEPELADAAN